MNDQTADTEVPPADEQGDEVVVVEDAPERGWRPRPAMLGAAAFLIYLVIAILLWGIPVLAHFTTRYVGNGRADTDVLRWAYAWTPWAVSHGVNPLFTDRVFFPPGIDLTWTALMPGPALIVWPITRAFGTLASTNALKLSSPALAAWGAYLVCRRLTGAFWASLVGGYLFGFSAYIVGQMLYHLNLIMVFPIPLVVYLVIRLVEGSLGRVAFLVLGSVTLLGLFSISTELFATTAFFGAIAFVIALVAGGRDRMRVVLAMALTGLAFAIVAAIVFVPYVLPVLRNAPASPIRPADKAAADLFGFVVPRHDQLIGGDRWTPYASSFTASIGEDGSYLGVALIAMLAGFAVTERRRRGTWALLAFIGVVCVLAMGPVLHVHGSELFTLPGKLLVDAPLIKNATPDRFPLYATLAVGVVAALWLARGRGTTGWVRWGIVLLGAVMLLPITSSAAWYPYDRSPTFFTDGTYATVLHPDENVFVITATNGEEMLWQSEAGFLFRMPEGYIGALPQGYGQDVLNKGIGVDEKDPLIPAGPQLASYLDRHGVTAVVVGDGARPLLEPVVRSAGMEPVYEAGGVSVWRSPDGSTAAGTAPGA
jgi:hypothetical protein